MALRENHNVKGKLDLDYYFCESASGHVEERKSRQLTVDPKNDKNVILEIVDEEVNYYKSSNSSKNNITYCISADKLAQLIIENGEKVRETKK